MWFVLITFLTTFANLNIPELHFIKCLIYRLATDIRKVKASGRGLQPAGVRVGDKADFKIYTEGAGEGRPDVKIVGPNGVIEPVKLLKVNNHQRS